MTARVAAVLIGTVLGSTSVHAQTTEFTYLHGGHAHGIAFAEAPLSMPGADFVGVNVGDGGRIRFSDDGGITWEDADVDPDYRAEFKAAFYLDSTNCWAVGEGGAVHRSTDSGETWVWINKGNEVMNFASPNPTPAELYDIWMTSPLIGWLVGTDGVILFTQNGGATWGPHPAWTNGIGVFPAPKIDITPGGATGDPADPYDIEIFGSTNQNIFVAADWGWSFYSHDGGLSWSTAFVQSCWETDPPTGPPTVYLELWDAAFDPDPITPGGSLHEGWMVGGNGFNGGMLYHTVDSGVTWTAMTETDRSYLAAAPGSCAPGGCSLPTYYGVDFFDSWLDNSGGTPVTVPSEVIAVSYQEGLHRYEANSGGSTVTVATPCDVTNPCALKSWTGAYWDQFQPLPATTAIHAPCFEPAPPLTTIFALDGQHAWLSGRFGSARRSTDGGSTWSTIDDEVSLRLDAGDFNSPDRGLVFGQKSIIERTTDGGVTWTATYPTAAPLPSGSGRDIALAFDGQAVAIGDNALLLYSTDHGATWANASPPGGTTDWNAVAVVTVVGGGGTVPNAVLVGQGGLIANSTDGGATWTDRSLSPNLTPNLRGVDITAGGITTVAYAVGDSSEVYRSTDGGTTWTAVPLRNSALSVNFNAVATWGLGDGAVAVGADGAVFTRNLSTGSMVKIDVASILAAELPELGTTDLYAVDVTNGGNTWMIGGEHGTVLRYHNGVWSAPKSKTEEIINSISFQNADQGFIIGRQFLIAEW